MDLGRMDVGSYVWRISIAFWRCERVGVEKEDS